VLAHEVPLLVVQGAGLVEDRVGNRHLSDVVELGRAGDGGALRLRHPQLVRHGLGELRHRVAVGAELGGALLQDPDENGLDLGRLRGTARVLIRIHPLVGELQRDGRVVRLSGQLRRAEGGRDVEALASLGQGDRPSGDDRGRCGDVPGDEQGELVAAEAVGAAAFADRVSELGAEPDQHGVAGRVAE
jgi:hypothetical protein